MLGLDMFQVPMVLIFDLLDVESQNNGLEKKLSTL